MQGLGQLLGDRHRHCSGCHAALASLARDLGAPLTILRDALHSLHDRGVDIDSTRPMVLRRVDHVSRRVNCCLRHTDVHNKALLDHRLRPITPLLSGLASTLGGICRHGKIGVSLSVSPRVDFINRRGSFIRIVNGILSGTYGCYLRFIRVSTERASRRLCVIIRSSNPNVPLDGQRIVFSHNRQISALHPKRNMKLTMTHRVARRCRNGVITKRDVLNNTQVRIVFNHRRSTPGSRWVYPCFARCIGRPLWSITSADL